MHTDKTDIIKMKKAGAKGYILKDTIGDTLNEAINRTLVGNEFFILR